MSTGESDPGIEGTGLDSAGWVSLLSFSWLNPLFKTGAARQLCAEDLPGLAREDRTAAWADRCDNILHLLKTTWFSCMHTFS